MYSGSMVGAGAMAFALMPYCIANARPDENCAVDLNPQVLAAVFGESKENVQSAINYLCSPDPLSRSQELDGRRLIHVGPGPFRYKVVNLQKYRDDAVAGERREYWRQHKAWERDGKPGGKFVFEVDKVWTNTPSPQPVHTTETVSGAGAIAGTPTPNPDRGVGVNGSEIPTPKPTPKPSQAQQFTIDQRIPDLQAKLGAMFNRPAGHVVTDAEELHLIAEIVRRPNYKSELESIKRLRSALPDRSKFPRSVVKLLQNWQRKLDEALSYQTPPSERSISDKDHEARMRDAERL